MIIGGCTMLNIIYNYFLQFLLLFIIWLLKVFKVYMWLTFVAYILFLEDSSRLKTANNKDPPICFNI